MRLNFFWLQHAKNRYLIPATVFAPEGGAPKKIVTLVSVLNRSEIPEPQEKTPGNFKFFPQMDLSETS